MTTWKEAIAANQASVAKLSHPEMSHILPALREIRDEVAATLKKGLKGEYSLHRQQSLLFQLNNAIMEIEASIPKAMFDQLSLGGAKASKLGLKNLQQMITAGQKKFGDSSPPLRLDVVRILDRYNLTAMSRHTSSAKKYAGRVGARVRRDLMLGVLKGESIEDIAKRMLGPKFDKLSAQGPEAVAKGMANKQLFKNKADAERLVRTELNNAYNYSQIEGLEEADADDPGWMKKWDSTNDKRACPDCRALDGVVVGLKQKFAGGVAHPPLHPNDRCCVVPWHRNWK